MKQLIYFLLFFSLSTNAQKPFFHAFDYFANHHDDEAFAYETSSAYLYHAYDTTARQQWLQSLDSLQRHFFFASAAFRVYDNSDCEQLMVYLPQYEAEFLAALRAVSFSEKEVSCFAQILANLSLCKRTGEKYRTYRGCNIGFNNDSHAKLMHTFVHKHFDQLFSTEFAEGIDPYYTGNVKKQAYNETQVLQVRSGFPVVKEIYDTTGAIRLRFVYSNDSKDSCRQWFYPNGQLEHEEITKPQVRKDMEYYASGKVFRTEYWHYRDSNNNHFDSTATLVFHENGQKLYESISNFSANPKKTGLIQQETAWDEAGRVVFNKGNGIRSTYELKDGKLHYAKQELELDSSLFLPFTPLLHWEDATRARVDSVTKRYLRTHSWTDYRTDARACMQYLDAATNTQLDSTQQAVLAPVFEIICSVYTPWSPEDSIGIAPLEPAKYPDEKWHKALIVDKYHGFPFREATLDRLYRLDNEEAVKEKTWLYAEKSGTTGTTRSAWDMLCFKIQYLKQTATPDELITWLCEPIGSLHYLYPEIWAYDTIYPSQNRALAATRDTMERLWLPKLRNLNKQVWKKLSKEERQQITALRKIYQEFITTYRANSALLRYRIHRNQTPQRTLFIESLYDFMEGSYPNFRYMNLTTSKPAGLSRNDLTMLSRSIYDALGAKKQELEQIEKQLFASLAPCSSIWITPFSWYWRGQDQEMLRALNLMMIE
ncbi:MAG TPA: hypothetical protein VK168_04560 [Saprospiraceae bacterium]|nr:hypothetical protein [Saprospiraceae bacterium]